jgi:hypothetical protein
MIVNVMRYPLTGTRADKELYDEFDLDQTDTPEAIDTLVTALRALHSSVWWYFAEPAGPETNRGAFYDPMLRKSNEPAESEFSPLLSALLSGASPTNA